MKKFLAHLFPVLVLAAFIFIMNSNLYFKQPRNGQESFPQYMELARENIQDGKWQEAQKNIKKAENVWLQLVAKLQFSVEREEINQLNRSLARLQGAVSAQDPGEALADLNEVIEHWYRLED